ncbi:K homology domain, prokaryotic type [Cynara cardunculus var. scolymus]|uniref:K homology domain, prokaryotic type n=1 Tax=Cynara cardunculus var. scolymus TaxID=59895 RepID=A0A103XSD2_CYNCS|nr:K homology domain, prokaryotic type [Cynara cardunculus var. scolymus]
MATQMSKKRKFVADGVFFAELNEVLTRELAEDGYSGVEVRVTPMRTEIIIRATRTQNVLGRILITLFFNVIIFLSRRLNFMNLVHCQLIHEEKLEVNSLVCICEKGRRIRELTSLVQKRFKFPENSVELYAERVNNRGLCAIAQAESLRYKLLGGLAVRRACYGVLRFVMENGAKGCEVIVSGKLRAQRAKSMKFKDGYMVSSGQPVKEYIDSAVRHVLLRQGVLGIKVKIMLDWDPTGKLGPKTPLPDNVIIHMPKDDVVALPPKEVEEYRPPLVVADEPLPMPIPVV